MKIRHIIGRSKNVPLQTFAKPVLKVADIIAHVDFCTLCARIAGNGDPCSSHIDVVVSPDLVACPNGYDRNMPAILTIANELSPNTRQRITELMQRNPGRIINTNTDVRTVGSDTAWARRTEQPDDRERLVRSCQFCQYWRYAHAGRPLFTNGREAPLEYGHCSIAGERSRRNNPNRPTWDHELIGGWAIEECFEPKEQPLSVVIPEPVNMLKDGSKRVWLEHVKRFSTIYRRELKRLSILIISFVFVLLMSAYIVELLNLVYVSFRWLFTGIP